MDLKTIRQTLSQRQGKKELIKKEIAAREVKTKELKRELKRHEQAKEVVKQVGLKTQQQLQYHISDITSLAIESVFPNPYKLEMEFVERRNKTECDLYFTRDGLRIDPISASGGGTVDVAAFALRIASWSLKRPNTRPTIILDEPMKYVSEEYIGKAAEMIKEVSKKLNIQFIIVTHEPKLTAFADKVFQTRLRNKVTRIKTPD
jgi:DNA repair exonuclease SbcCD ATPase subunit